MQWPVNYKSLFNFGKWAAVGMPVFLDWQHMIWGKGVQDIVFLMIESYDIDAVDVNNWKKMRKFLS